MKEQFNYDNLFAQSISRIKNKRTPQAKKQDDIDLRWDLVEENRIFDFGGRNFSRSSAIIDSARAITFSCLQFIIISVGNLYGKDLRLVKAEVIQETIVDYNLSKIEFAIIDPETSTLLLFKDVEKTNFWRKKNVNSKEIASLINKCNCTSCKYIYFMYDYAYLQIVGHNDDNNDPGRGYNVYSLKWFFTTYFGAEEYKRFEKSLKRYIDEVNSFVGFTIMRTLSPWALINFRRITRNQLTNHNYDHLLEKTIKDKNGKVYRLNNTGYSSIKEQYYEDDVINTMLGKGSFAESLITAEWLYSTMKKAKAIDLTVIGTGYFKAVEQLLFELICLHSGEHRVIKSDSSRKDLPYNIELTDQSINEMAIDSSIGSMAVFVKNNLDIFRGDIGVWAKNYIREMVFDFAKLRNGYFHKDNIHNWDKIDEIREATFDMIFVLLGAKDFGDLSLERLGLIRDEYSDYEKLCEYVDFHRNEWFFLDFDYAENQIAISRGDQFTQMINERKIKYSGVYFQPLGKNELFRFTEDSLPKRISLGKSGFEQTELISINPSIVTTVFENGKYVGPDIAEEIIDEY